MSIVQKTISVGPHAVEHVTLTNPLGMSVELMTWGATLIDVCVPDRDGNVQSVTLAHRNMDQYKINGPYFGCVVGRVAGRIAHGQFCLAGQSYQLDLNQGAHHLHGGVHALSHQAWDLVSVQEHEMHLAAVFSIHSPAGQNGYPADMQLIVTYQLSKTENTLTIDYRGVADQPTLCNPTHHAYFNLSGDVSRLIGEHELEVNASYVCAMSDELLVTGDLWPVVHTDFDFRQPKKLASILSSADARIVLAKGVDHYFVLENATLTVPQVVLSDPSSGRRLTVYTDQPCVVLYAHNYAGGELLRHHRVGQDYDALCIETQRLPIRRASTDARHTDDHTAALYPDQTYKQTTRFVFDVIN